MSTTFTHRIELKRSVLQTMADALGDDTKIGRDGPAHSNLLDNSSGTASNLVNGVNNPSGRSMATIGARLAAALGMEEFDEDAVWDAIRATHQIVKITDKADA